MEKKAKVTKVTRLDKLDSYGNTSFIIEFENTDKGFYTTKAPDTIKFIAGNVCDYDIEQKEGRNGPYFKVTLPQSEKPAFSGGGKPQINPKVQMIGFSASYAKDLIVAGKVDIKEFESLFNRIYTVMISKL